LLKPKEPFSFEQEFGEKNSRILKEWFCKNRPSPEWQTIAVIPKRQI
jgi:hypothetical protein